MLYFRPKQLPRANDKHWGSTVFPALETLTLRADRFVLEMLYSSGVYVQFAHAAHSEAANRELRKERWFRPHTIMITYALDVDNKLVDVGGDWDAFARANHGEGLSRDHVLGLSLFRFIRGAEVSAIYKALFAKVRTQQRAISFAFRCDSPTCQRRMMLHITPLPLLGLAVQTDLLEETVREEVPLLNLDKPQTEESIQICCICSDVRTGDNTWVPIEEESTRRHLLECDAVPRLSHGFCPRCLENQLMLLEDNRR